jgi:glutathione S-transferase
MEGRQVIRVYGYAASINVRKVLWMCDELGAPYIREDWGGPGRSIAEPSFRALNPVRLVPVVDDCGFVVWESNTIVRYLASSRKRTDLLPAEPAARAQVESWMDWQGSDFNNSWRFAFQGLVRRNVEYRDGVGIARSVEGCNGCVAAINDHLKDRGGYLVGDRFTVADIAIGLSIHRWRLLPVSRPTFPAVDRYYDRLCEREPFRRHGRDGGP